MQYGSSAAQVSSGRQAIGGNAKPRDLGAFQCSTHDAVACTWMLRTAAHGRRRRPLPCCASDTRRSSTNWTSWRSCWRQVMAQSSAFHKSPFLSPSARPPPVPPEQHILGLVSAWNAAGRCAREDPASVWLSSSSKMKNSTGILIGGKLLEVQRIVEQVPCAAALTSWPHPNQAPRARRPR